MMYKLMQIMFAEQCVTHACLLVKRFIGLRVTVVLALNAVRKEERNDATVQEVQT